MRETKKRGDFVERLAGGVVDRAPQAHEIQRPLAAIEARVPATHDQSYARKNLFARRDPTSIDMRLQMVHRDQGNLERDGQRLRRRQADEQRAGQPGRVGHGHGVELIGLASPA